MRSSPRVYAVHVIRLRHLSRARAVPFGGDVRIDTGWAQDVTCEQAERLVYLCADADRIELEGRALPSSTRAWLIGELDRRRP